MLVWRGHSCPRLTICTTVASSGALFSVQIHIRKNTDRSSKISAISNLRIFDPCEPG